MSEIECLLLFVGRNEHLNQPLTVSLAPGYTRYGRGSPDAKQMLSGPGITYGSSPQRKSRNRRRSDVTQKIDHTKIDGYRGDEPVDKLLEYIEGSQISIKDVKRQKKKV